LKNYQNNIKVLCVTWAGIAANLLPDGMHIVIVLGDDFKQRLPVVRRGNWGSIVNATIK